jgi:hypothetical protein
MAEKVSFMDIVKTIGELVGQATPGLTLDNILSDVKAEASRLGEQGKSEASAWLFGDRRDFVLYGPGQDISKHQENTADPPATEQEKQIDEQHRGIEI